MDRKLGGLTLALCAGVAYAQTPQWFRYEASPEQITLTEQAIAEQLKDPDSAKFKGIFRLTSTDGKNAYCGQVNSKNSYGGYSGFTAFYFAPDIGNGNVWMSDSGPGRIIVEGACSKPAKTE